MKNLRPSQRKKNYSIVDGCAGNIGKILIAASVLTNGEKILSTKTGKDNIGCLNGIRSVQFKTLGKTWKCPCPTTASSMQVHNDDVGGARTCLLFQAYKYSCRQPHRLYRGENLEEYWSNSGRRNETE